MIPKKGSFVSVSILCAVFFAGGLWLFLDIHKSQRNWNRYQALAESGKIVPVEATIVGRSEGKNSDTADWGVTFSVEGGPVPIHRNIPEDTWVSLREGQKVPVYPVENTYYVPLADAKSDAGPYWVFLLAGMFPAVLALLLNGVPWLVGRRRIRPVS